MKFEKLLPSALACAAAFLARSGQSEMLRMVFRVFPVAASLMLGGGVINFIKPCKRFLSYFSRRLL